MMLGAPHRDGDVVQELQISEQPPAVKASQQPLLAWRHRESQLVIGLQRRCLVAIPACTAHQVGCQRTDDKWCMCARVQHQCVSAGQPQLAHKQILCENATNTIACSLIPALTELAVWRLRHTFHMQQRTEPA